MQKNLKRVISIYFMISICLCFSACGTVNEEQPVEESEANISGEYNFQLESSEDKIEQLTENIKTSYESDETNSYNILNQETVENDWTKYGEMETVHEEFPNEDGSVTFYYDMECFYFDDTYPEVLNETLQTYYASVEESYLQDSQVYTEPLEENTNIPYDSLIFQYFTYVEEDYVSLVYNNVCYMGGAHPYSAMDEADVIILASPVYVYHSTGAMKAFLDHYGYRWMVHSPEESMFKKQGVCISTAAGAGMKSTNDSECLYCENYKNRSVPRLNNSEGAHFG